MAPVVDLSRISLRPFKLSDVDDFLLWAGDDQVTRNIRWKTCGSREEALNFIRDVCIPHPWRRSICLDDRSIGFVSVKPWSGDDRCKADIGYAISVAYWGQGITTKALKIAVSQVFKDFPNLLRLQAFADVENKASQRVLEKAGFLKEGILRKYTYLKGNIKDLVVFSFLSTDEIPRGD
ncbi:GNAT domain [Sesbania bispinosa]|nr:GNAT domain [Sesbania bispinosa]